MGALDSGLDPEGRRRKDAGADEGRSRCRGGRCRRGTKTYEIVAAKAGRRVEISNIRGAIEVSEVTRTGVVVRSSRFMANRVVALIEYPAADDSDKAASAQASML